MRFLFIGSLEQYEAMKPFFGRLEKVIAMAPQAASAGDAKIVSFQAVLDMGAKRVAASPGEYLRLSEGINEQDTATLIYTSGSTGVPKGVTLTHRNLVTQVLGAVKRFPLDPKSDVILSCLPLAHVFERLVAYYYLYSGCMQPGNTVRVVWRARLDEHLGNYAVEPLHLHGASQLAASHVVYGVTHLGALCRLLPERDPHPEVHDHLAAMLERLDDPMTAGLEMVRFELQMLVELGFGLDLTSCAATGAGG